MRVPSPVGHPREGGEKFQASPRFTRNDPAEAPVGSVTLTEGKAPYQSDTHSHLFQVMSAKP